MKKLTAATAALAAALLSAAALASPQAARTRKVDRSAELQSVVRAEREFSRTAAERGTRGAFLSFIADDGILFRPGPVNGREFLSAQPDRPGLLAWEPAYADVSRAGDMGVTTGPWEFRQKSGDERPAAHGQFMTVWGKQPGGVWKFLIDVGVSHPAPQTAPPSLSFASDFRQNTDKEKLDVETGAVEKNLLKLEREFSRASSADTAKAFDAYADEDARLLREGHFPATGRASVRRLLTASPHTLTWEPLAARSSRSGDLGYTYGTYELKPGAADGGKPGTERGHYTRVWKRKADGRWRFVIDMLNPLPPK